MVWDSSLYAAYWRRLKPATTNKMMKVWLSHPLGCALGRDTQIMPDKVRREKKHRLALENYKGFNTVTFTGCVSNRKRLFIATPIFSVFEEILINELERQVCQAHVYLFMPDHVHLTIQGKTEEADLWKCMVLFKQKSGYWLSKNSPAFEWQKDFYDHILRKDEDIKKHVEYILLNPVRKRLVENWQDYPYKGSTAYNLGSWGQ